MDWLGIALGSMAIVMIRHLTGGGWGTVIRRILGAAMRTLPVMFVLFIPSPSPFCNTRCTHGSIRWTQVADPHHPRASREAQVHPAVVPDALRLHHPRYRLSRGLEPALVPALAVVEARTDSPGAPDNTQKFKAVAGPGLILYGFTISFAAIDWIMSLDPSWVSTIYGLIILIGEVLAAMCFAIVVERILVDYKPMSEMLRPDFVHDHGKWTLAFIMVWAYFNFSQWLIIWAGNLPHEITFYVKRINRGWGYVAVFLVLFHFVIPFVILLSVLLSAIFASWCGWRFGSCSCALSICSGLSNRTSPRISPSPLPTSSCPSLSAASGYIFFCRNLASLPLLPAYDVSAEDVFEPHPTHTPGIPENA